MDEATARDHLLDTSALAALPTSRTMSTLIVTAPLLGLTLFAPVACVDAADRIRPGIARHISRVPAIEPCDLTYAAVLSGREHTPGLPLALAQVLHLARENWLDLLVTTAQPELYRDFNVPIYRLRN